MKVEVLELADVLNNVDLKIGSFKEAIALIEQVMENDFQNDELSLSWLMCSDALTISGKYLLFAKIPYNYYTLKRRQPLTIDFVKDICRFGLENNLIVKQEFHIRLLASDDVSMLSYWFGILLAQVENSYLAKCMDW